MLKNSRSYFSKEKYQCLCRTGLSLNCEGNIQINPTATSPCVRSLKTNIFARFDPHGLGKLFKRFPRQAGPFSAVNRPFPIKGEFTLYKLTTN